MLQIDSAVFAALGDSTRLQMIACLADGAPRPIRQLTQQTSISRQAVTKHLQVLEKAGLVKASKIGRENRFALNPDGLKPAQTYLNEISEQWDAALLRLADHVEKG